MPFGRLIKDTVARRDQIINQLAAKIGKEQSARLDVLSGHAISTLTARETFFTERQLGVALKSLFSAHLAATTKDLPPQSAPQVIDQLVERQIAAVAKDTVRYPRFQGDDGKPRITTVAMVTAESELEFSAKLLSQSPPRPAETVEAGMQRFHDNLAQRGLAVDAENAEAMRVLLRNSGLTVFDGPPGAGKSTHLGMLAAVAAEIGQPIVVTASTAMAGANLAKDIAKAVPAGTEIRHMPLPELLSGLRDRSVPPSLILADEAGMIGTRDMAALLRGTRMAGCDAVLTGDLRQQPPAQAGDPYRTLAAIPGVSMATLSVPRRQRDGADQKATAQLHAGNAQPALDHYQAKGALTFQAGSVVETAADTYMANIAAGKGPTQVITLDQSTADSVNRAIRDRLGRAGTDGPAAGDRLYLTAAAMGKNTDGSPRPLAEGTLATVAETGAGTVVLDVDGNRTTVAAKDLQARDGFAITVRDSQCLTIDPITVIERRTDQAETLVALSRHRQDVKVIVDAKVYPDTKALAQDSSRRADKAMVSDMTAAMKRRSNAQAR